MAARVSTPLPSRSRPRVGALGVDICFSHFTSKWDMTGHSMKKSNQQATAAGDESHARRLCQINSTKTGCPAQPVMVVRVLLSNNDPSQDSGFQTTPPDLPSLSNSAPFSSQATPAGSLGALGGRWLSPLGRPRREVRLRLPWPLANVDLRRNRSHKLKL